MGNNNMQNMSSNKIRVQVQEICKDYIECSHLVSGFKMRAQVSEKMQLEVGQIVMVEYKRDALNTGYKVIDDLMEELEAKVLEAQHIISDGIMYTSLILENPETKQRMHSIIPSTNRLFCNTNVIITGDIVKLKLNNGNIFNIYM